MILPLGYIPKKFLGQNFLHDHNIINKVIQFIHPKKDQILVEIGSGLAALTKPICDFLDYLFIIEIDEQLLLYLKKFNFYKKLDIFKGDVLKFNFYQLYTKHKKMLRIFGNLPYNISVKLILHLIFVKDFIFDMNFMVQKEVGCRLLAQPGNKCYGRLSIIIQCYYDITFGFNILPQSFFPVPKVESSFIKLIPKTVPLYPINKINNLKKVTFFAFKSRRKILKNSLSDILNYKDLLKLNINYNLRAENISVLEYCRIANYLHDN